MSFCDSSKECFLWLDYSNTPSDLTPPKIFWWFFSDIFHLNFRLELPTLIVLLPVPERQKKDGEKKQEFPLDEMTMKKSSICHHLFSKGGILRYSSSKTCSSTRKCWNILMALTTHKTEQLENQFSEVCGGPKSFPILIISRSSIHSR